MALLQQAFAQLADHQVPRFYQIVSDIALYLSGLY
jgi:hypothetical protein